MNANQLKQLGYHEQPDGIWSKNKPIHQGVCPAEPEQPARLPLVSPVPGEVPSRARAKIVFTVHSRRPLDWDNWRLKDLQDCIVKSGILDGDEWDILEGTVISKKTRKEEEEGTQIEIIRL